MVSTALPPVLERRLHADRLSLRLTVLENTFSILDLAEFVGLQGDDINPTTSTLSRAQLRGVTTEKGLEEIVAKIQDEHGMPHVLGEAYPGKYPSMFRCKDAPTDQSDYKSVGGLPPCSADPDSLRQAGCPGTGECADATTDDTAKRSCWGVQTFSGGLSTRANDRSTVIDPRCTQRGTDTSDENSVRARTPGSLGGIKERSLCAGSFSKTVNLIWITQLLWIAQLSYIINAVIPYAHPSLAS
eukprot:COSAG01_NODE_1204_length_11247_cov_5.362397_3_plen_243_part_00